MSENTEAKAYCSFCGKSQVEVAIMIAGPGMTFICDECVQICLNVVVQKSLADAIRAEIGEG